MKDKSAVNFEIAGMGKDASELPKELDAAVENLELTAFSHKYAVICMVMIDGGPEHPGRIKLLFSPHSAANPEFATMCSDIGGMFRLVAERLRQ